MESFTSLLAERNKKIIWQDKRIDLFLNTVTTQPIDIWSCGIILYMLFTMGKHPFKNSTETREEYVKRLISLNTSNKTPSTEIAFAKTP